MTIQSIVLGALAEVTSGGGAPQDSTSFGSDGEPFVRAGSLIKLLGGASEESLEKVTPLAARSHRLRLFPAGTVLFAKSGMSALKGYVYALRRPAYVVNHLAALVPRDPRDSRFLVQALRYSSPVALVKDGAYPSIRLADIAAMRIAAPADVAKRRRLAEVLDRTEDLGAKRRRSIATVDALIQSIFVDMFGEPASNPRGWPWATLGDVVTQICDGPHVSPSYVPEGVPFISTRHVRPGAIAWEDLKYISDEDAAVLWKKCRPHRGDVLYTKGGTTGLAAEVRTDAAFATWVHVAVLRPNAMKVEPGWLEAILNWPFCYEQSQRLTHGIANRDLGLTRMTKIKLYLPPLAMQRGFIAKRDGLRAVRDRAELAGHHVDSLFSSLQHLAFCGEL